MSSYAIKKFSPYNATTNFKKLIITQFYALHFKQFYALYFEHDSSKIH